MTEAQRELINILHDEGHESAAIAKRLGIPLDLVRSHLGVQSSAPTAIARPALPEGGARVLTPAEEDCRAAALANEILQGRRDRRGRSEGEIFRDYLKGLTAIKPTPLGGTRWGGRSRGI